MSLTMAGFPELEVIANSKEWLASGEPENADRLAMAAKVLCSFAEMTGLSRSGDAVETIMVDLVADLMHLADHIDIDFAAINAVADMHYQDERGS